MYEVLIKRPFDFFTALFALIILFPVLVMVAVLVRFRLGAPVLFKQVRPGIYGQPFMIMKFRTMTDERDGNGDLLPDEVRLTAFGKFLRSTSLDELPELINVLRGDMSLVGPRPLLTQYLDRYSYEQARRHDVKPGITGWAQINGRNAISWEDRFKLDIWYVDNLSPWLDIKIIIMTVAKVIKRADITEEGQATMTEFYGDESKTEDEDETVT